jgi:hypothetical protein
MTQISKQGEQAHNHKLTEKEVMEIRKRYAAGETNKVQLAKAYGVTRSNIYWIVTRKCWTHI